MTFAAVLAVVSAGLAVAGGVMQGVAARNASMAQAQAANYNASVQQQNAVTVADQTSVAIDDQRRDSLRRLDRIRSLYASSGIVAGAGSALAVYQDQATEDKLQQLRTSYEGKVRATGYQRQAALDKMEARSSRSAASIGFASGVVSGLGSALTIG